MRRISRLSDEYVRVPVWAREDGVDVDVTLSTTVKVAFVTNGDWDPDPNLFVLGEWEKDVPRKITYARRRVSGLDPGKYRMWIKPEGAGVAPEAPAVFTDVLFEVV